MTQSLSRRFAELQRQFAELQRQFAELQRVNAQLLAERARTRKAVEELRQVLAEPPKEKGSGAGD